MSNTRKKYEELQFSDDFAFCKILGSDEELCMELLEMILGKRVHLVSENAQQYMKATPDGKGIRLDVYLEDDTQTIYDVEMQKTSNRNLPKRSRYYQSMIDVNILEQGVDYLALKESIVIFICIYDLFGRGLHKYTFTNICEELPELKLMDETTKVFLCAGGEAGDVSPKMNNFLNYLVDNQVRDSFTEKLEKSVKDILHKNQKWRQEYMILALRDQDNQAIGEKRGEKRGEKIGENKINRLIQRLLADARVDDLRRSTSNPDYQKQLMKEYGIK